MKNLLVIFAASALWLSANTLSGAEAAPPMIVHAKVDDGSQPVGNAGAPIACGVIGLANPGK